MFRAAEQIVRVSAHNEISRRYARNSRTHIDGQVGQIAAPIKEWGWTVTVLIDPEGGLIAGHGRILAVQNEGRKVVKRVLLKARSDGRS